MAQQRDIFEIVIESENRRRRRASGILFQIIRSLALPVFYERRDRLQQLVKIRHPGLPLQRVISLVIVIQPAFIRYLQRKLVGISILDKKGQCVNHVAERADLCDLMRSTEHGGAPPGCRLGNRLESRLPYSPRRAVDYPPERLVVQRVDAELEIRHHILHLLPVKERISGIYHIRYIAPAELLLKCPGLGIGSVQYCEVLILRPFRMHPLQYVSDDHDSLLLLGISFQEPDPLTVLADGVTFLRDAPVIVVYDRIGRRDDILGRTVITFKAEDFAFRIVFLEIQDILNLGTAEGVD